MLRKESVSCAWVTVTDDLHPVQTSAALLYIRHHGFDLNYVNFTSGETGYHLGPTPVN